MTAHPSLTGIKTKPIDDATWVRMQASWRAHFGPGDAAPGDAADIAPTDFEAGVRHNRAYIESGAADLQLRELYELMTRCAAGEGTEVEPRVASACLPVIESRAMYIGLPL